MRPIERHCRPRPKYFSLITFDGSLTGGGATLQIGLHDLSEAEHRPIVAYWHGQWSDDELQMLQVTRGSPSGQARLEAYTLLVALTTWREVLATTQGTLAVLGDALGVLYDVMKLRARDSVLNSVAGEMALVLAPLGLDTRAAHLWTQRNCGCDALSRLLKGQSCELPQLQAATEVSRGRVAGSLLRTL